MLRGRHLALLTTAALVLAALPLTLAHGGDEPLTSSPMDMGMGGSNNASSLSAPLADMAAASASEAYDPTYFSLHSHAALMYAHIFLMTFGWAILLPLTVMLSIAKSRLAIFLQCSFLFVNAFGILTTLIYNHNIPDLYKGNSHHKAGWAITWIAVAWVVLGLVNRYKERALGYALAPTDDRHHTPISARAMAEHHRWHDLRSQISSHRWSRDSGQGTERNSASLCSTRSPSVQSEANHSPGTPPSPRTYDDDEDASDDIAKHGFLNHARTERFVSRLFPRFKAARALGILGFLHTLLERTILQLGFVAFTSGIVVFGGVFRGDHVFSGLAHFIKGGIFFWYGLFALGRWAGSFADFGWAWNVKPSVDVVGRRKARVRSAEFAESFLIWFYGASNVFLEHLSNWGNEWSAVDLEHIAITILFFGGGILGMLIESRKTRELLNDSIVGSRAHGPRQDDGLWQQPKTYSTSLNPIPALVIMLLGLMMSSHHQDSVVSTMMHKQWGMLLAAGALARAVTYITLYLSPPSSYLPSRPPSELVAAFCMVSGGLVFMGSSLDTVKALEAHHLDAMFVFTVTMGFTALLMAWTVVVIAVKGWAMRREGKHAFLSTPSAAPSPAPSAPPSSTPSDAEP